MNQVEKKLLTHECAIPLDILYDILSYMPLPSELELNHVKLNFEVGLTNEKPIILKKLTKLTIHFCDWNLFELFMVKPIKEVKISNKLAVMDHEQRNTFIRFLESSHQLESIHLDENAFAVAFETQLNSTVGFELKRVKASLYAPGYQVPQTFKNFATFLESQASSLKELDFNHVFYQVIDTIFPKLYALEILILKKRYFLIVKSFITRSGKNRI